MWPKPQFPANLVTFTEEILNGKLFAYCHDCDLWLKYTAYDIVRYTKAGWFNA